MLWSHKFKILNYDVLFKIQTMKYPNIRCRGFSSRLKGTSLHIPCLDYDNIVDERGNEDRLTEELSFLQEEFEIGNFYVFKTRDEGRHAICIDAMRFVDVLEIVRFSSCDALFKRAPRINEYRCWILRISKKGDRDAPKYLYTVESPYEGINLQSRAHAKLLLKYGVKVDLKNPYGTEEIELQEYNTRKKPEEKEEGEA